MGGGTHMAGEGVKGGGAAALVGPMAEVEDAGLASSGGGGRDTKQRTRCQAQSPEKR
jgi:hypothetical protein